MRDTALMPESPQVLFFKKHAPFLDEVRKSLKLGSRLDAVEALIQRCKSLPVFHDAPASLTVNGATSAVKSWDEVLVRLLEFALDASPPSVLDPAAWEAFRAKPRDIKDRVRAFAPLLGVEVGVTLHSGTTMALHTSGDTLNTSPGDAPEEDGQMAKKQAEKETKPAPVKAAKAAPKAKEPKAAKPPKPAKEPKAAKPPKAAAAPKGNPLKGAKPTSIAIDGAEKDVQDVKSWAGILVVLVEKALKAKKKSAIPENWWRTEPNPQTTSTLTNGMHLNKNHDSNEFIPLYRKVAEILDVKVKVTYTQNEKSLTLDV